MNALLDLKRFIACNSRPDETHEVLRTVIADAERYAPEFGVSPERFMIALLRPEHDAQILGMLRTAIKDTESRKRQRKAQGRALTAAESAKVIGDAATWEGERAHLDMACVIASVLTKPTTLLVFRGESFEIAVCMKPLLSLGKLGKRDLTGWVDERGLHIRWNAGRGGLDLRHQVDVEAERIAVNLPARAASIAA
jgi:hypothetical protein